MALSIGFLYFCYIDETVSTTGDQQGALFPSVRLMRKCFLDFYFMINGNFKSFLISDWWNKSAESVS